MITIDPETGEGTLVGSTVALGPVTEIEFRDDGALFGATGGATSRIITLDIFSGQPTLVGTHEPDVVTGLAFDSTGTLFGTHAIRFTEVPSQLVTVDTETGALTFIGPTGFNIIGGLVFSPNGALYGVSRGDFITIDPATGEGTLVGPTGFFDVAALEFGPDGILYGRVGGGDFENRGSLISIDPTTGAGTVVGSSGFPVISGLSFTTLEGAQISVNHDSIDFGNVEVGVVSPSQMVTIRNLGPEDLTISDISNPGAPFSLSNVPTFPVVIPAAGSITVEVTFVPTAAGIPSSTIIISSDDQENPAVEVALTGQGVVLNPAELGVCGRLVAITPLFFLIVINR